MYKSGVTVSITKEQRGYGAHGLVNNVRIDTYGNSLEELQDRFIRTVNSKFGPASESYGSQDIEFRIDFKSFFDYYKDFHVFGSDEYDWREMKTLGPAY